MTETSRRSAALPDSSPPDRRLLRQVASLGLAMFVVSLGTFAPESAPDPGKAMAAQVRSYASANATTIQVNTLTALVWVALLVFFAAALARQVRAAGSGTVGSGALVGLAAVVATVALFTAAASSVFARPDLVADVADEAVVSFYTVSAVAEWWYTLTVLVPAMVLMATYSVLALRHRLVARWVAWFGLLIAAAGAAAAVAHVVPSVRFDPLVVPLFGWWLWPLAVGGAAGIRWWRLRAR